MTHESMHLVAFCARPLNKRENFYVLFQYRTMMPTLSGYLYIHTTGGLVLKAELKAFVGLFMV
jgi:hypothetical protein